MKWKESINPEKEKKRKNTKKNQKKKRFEKEGRSGSRIGDWYGLESHWETLGCTYGSLIRVPSSFGCQVIFRLHFFLYCAPIIICCFSEHLYIHNSGWKCVVFRSLELLLNIRIKIAIKPINYLTNTITNRSNKHKHNLTWFDWINLIYVHGESMNFITPQPSTTQA